MDHLLDFKDGVSGLLVSLCVVGSIQIVLKVGEFLWKLKEKKEAASETTVQSLVNAVNKSTVVMEHLDRRLGALESTLSEFPKFKQDQRRFYVAIKILAGENWEKVKKEIEDIPL